MGLRRGGGLGGALGPGPALLCLAALDLACRLYFAAALELHHLPVTRWSALAAAGLGVLRDLLVLAPLYVLRAWRPARATRIACRLGLAATLVVLAADAVYFHVTLHHIEPVLFVNLNTLSIRGSLGPASALAVLLVLAAVALLVLLDAAGPPARPARGRAALSWLVVPALLAPLAIRTTPAAQEERDADAFRERRSDYVARVATPMLVNLARAALAGRRIEAPLQVAFQPYSEPEARVLRELGLLHADAAAPAGPAAGGPEIRRIALLVLESLPAAYLHGYNPRVPAEATPFLDALLREHPHLDRFYTANTPSDWGLNSLLLSRLRPDWDGGRPSLLSVLREARGFRSTYVRGVSKHYGNELETYPKLFQMDDYIAYEELRPRYDTRWHSAWGLNNRVVYEEGIRLLRAHRDERVIVVLKTIDLHQPGPFEGVPRRYLPEALQREGNRLFNALHWVDLCLRGFFEALEAQGLLDEQTLVVVTSDHSPHPGVDYRATVPEHEYVRLGRLPLVFVTRHPTALARLDTGALASQVDLAPTLLDLLGLDKPRGMVGRSLLRQQAKARAFGVYRDTFYYRGEEGEGRAGSFTVDVAKPAGPGEQAIAKWLSNLDVELDVEVDAAEAPAGRALR